MRIEIASWSEITPSVHHRTYEQCPGDPGLVMAAGEEVDIHTGEEHVPLLLPQRCVSK